MMKQLIAFDLDGTLAPSKSALDGEMAAHLRACLTANGFAY
jgi:hydroxymethylpyrimidine pyrophosphatase-like HAD family hydrolase